MTDDLVIGHRAVMASVKLGSWMSAALDDPNTCEAMKADIREWFSAGDECSRLTDRIEALTAENERLREALTDIGVYGCGMLNQPAAMNGPEEAWLRLRIREMENVARAALGDTQ